MKPILMSEKEYRAKPCISSSDIRNLLENPYFFKNGIKKEETETLLLGRAIHSLILESENFNRDFLIKPKFDLRKTADKEANAQFLTEAESSNKSIIDSVLFEKAKEVAEAFKENPLSKILSGGIAEASFFGKIADVDCKCRPDYFNMKKSIIFDLKTTSKKGGASQNEFIKSVANFGYYIQAWFYKAITGAENFYFIVIETEYPYMAGVYSLDNISLEFGQQQVEKAFEILRNIDKFKEPCYLNPINYKYIQTLSLPNWVYYQ